MAFFMNTLFADVVASLATLTVVVYLYFKWRHQYWKRRNLPYLEPSIPFGNMPNPISSALSAGEKALELYNEAKAKGYKECGIYAATAPMLMVLDLELLKRIMTKDFNYFVDRGVYYNEKDDPLSAHLFALAGNKWKRLRAKLSPTFTSGKMKVMFQTMADCGEILQKYVAEEIADQKVVDIKVVLARFTTDIIGSCAFGLNCNSFKDPNSPFCVYGRKVFENSILEQSKAIFALSFSNVAKKLGVRVFKRDITDFYQNIVNDTISYRIKNNITRNDFLQLLMEMKEKEGSVSDNGNTLTMNEIEAQSFVFFIAGFETSSTTMTFALFEMARHPEIQEKVRQEIRAVLAKHGNKITYDSINELVYMKQVIDETLRKYPPVPSVTRLCLDDYKVPEKNFVIEKDTLIFISIIGLHYDENYYNNPEKFDPDRFAPENRNNIPQYAYIPFGEGPRICIGERFGILQTKVGLTSILMDFKISLNEKTKLPLKMDPRSPITSVLGGIWLNLERV